MVPVEGTYRVRPPRCWSARNCGRATPQNCTKIAKDFKEIAGRVDVGAKGRLSPQQQAEKSHYLAESKRVRDAAKRKDAAGAPTVIGDRS